MKNKGVLHLYQSWYILMFVLAVIGTCHSAEARDKGVNDDQLWLSSGADLEFGKDFKIGLGYEYRLHEDISEMKNMLASIDLEYELTNWLEVSFELRYNNYNSGYHQFEYRPGIKLSYKLGNFKLASFTRYDSEDRPDKYDKSFLRQKFEIEYHIKKLAEPFIEYEAYYALRGRYTDRWMKYRLTTGLSFEPWKDGQFKLFYRYQEEFNMKNNDKIRITGISYKHDIKIF